MEKLKKILNLLKINFGLSNIILVGVIFLIILTLAFGSIIKSFNSQVNIDSIDSNTSETLNEEGVNEKDISLDTQVDDEPVMYFQIDGAITNPGVYELTPNMRLNDAITVAGGLKNANSDCLNLASSINDEDKIIIPSSDTPCDDTNLETSESAKSSESDLININTADVTELQQLPNIGATKAQAIVDYREENGNFQSIEDINNVPGVGDSTYQLIMELITV